MTIQKDDFLKRKARDFQNWTEPREIQHQIYQLSMEVTVRHYQDPLIPDVAYHIFGFLDTATKQVVASVCRLWNRIVYLPRHWRNVTAELPATCSEVLIRSLAKRQITRISCPRSSFEDLALVFALLPDVCYLNVGGCPRVTALQMKREFCHLYSLKHLVFKHCSRINDAFLKACAPSLKNLKSVVLQDCENITELGLSTFLKHVDGLEKLNLSWCENIKGVCLQHIAFNCAELRSLVLRGCNWITTGAMRHLVDHVPKLVHLDFHWSLGLTDEGVKILVEALPNLKYLDVKECPLVTFKGIHYVAQNLHQLVHLAFGGKDNFDFSPTDAELEIMFHELATMAKLQSLEFDAELVSDTCMSTLLKQLPNLTSLHMGIVDNITDITAVHIAKFSPNLQSLSMSSPHLQDQGIISVAENLKKLVSLDLWNCPITSNGLEVIAPHLASLKSLVISHETVTDVGVKSLALNAKSLTCLDLWECDYITDAGITSVATNMVNLQKLILTLCPRITDKGEKY